MNPDRRSAGRKQIQTDVLRDAPRREETGMQMTVLWGIVRTERAAAARMEGPEGTARVIAAGTVLREIARTEDREAIVRVLAAETVLWGTVRMGDREATVPDITGITEAQTVQTITAGTVLWVIVRTEGRVTVRAVSEAGAAETVLRADVRTAGADRAAGIRLAVR